MPIDLTLAQRLLDVFDGNRAVYAVGQPHRIPAKAAIGKFEYFPVHEPLTPEVVLSHLEGERLVGVYPIQDQRVKWFALDFDAVKDDQGLPVGTFDEVFKQAVAQARKFKQAMLFTHGERSRSGLGVHLWGFLDDWVEAGVVRRAVRPFLADDDTFDRMYPMQDELAPGKLGNLIALPFHGTSFENGNSAMLFGTQVVGPDEFLSAVLRKNGADTIRLLADKAPKPRPEARREARGPVPEDYAGRPDRPIVGVLKAISKYGCNFLRTTYFNRKNPKIVNEAAWYAMLGQLTAFDQGRDAAHAFSEGHPQYSPTETDNKFDHAFENPPVGCAFIHDNFPKLACKGCPMKAPYWSGKKSVLELVQGSTAVPAKPQYDKTLGWVRRVNAGEEDPGISWNMPGFERTMLRNGELTVMGAPPSMGKTAHMVHAAAAVASQGVPVLVFSAETGDRSLQIRLLSHIAKIDSRALRGERLDPYLRPQPLLESEYRKLDAASKTLSGLPLYTEYTAVSADAMLEGIERVLLRERIPLDSPYVVFFDYLQFGAKEDSESNYEHVSRLVRQFKAVAQIIDRPVVIYSQLKRASYNKSKEAEELDQTPTISDFKESGRIEADADVAAIIWGDRADGAIVSRKITWVKQREGEANFTVHLLLDQSTCTYIGSNTQPAPDRPNVLGDDDGLKEFGNGNAG